MNLGERREKKVAQWKAAGKSVDKEERLEFERDYRTSFMTVVLKGLEQSRWPPSQVPFADPMDDLLHNKETLLDAINHLLNTLFPSSAPPSAPPKRLTPTKTPVRQPDDDEEEPSDSDQEHTPPRPGSTKATPRENHDSFNNPMEVSTASSILKRFGKMDVSHDIEPPTSHRSTRGRNSEKSIDQDWNTPPASVKSSFRGSSAYESHHSKSCLLWLPLLALTIVRLDLSCTVGETATGDDKKLVEVRFSFSFCGINVHILVVLTSSHLLLSYSTYVSIVFALPESLAIDAATSSEASRHPSESSRDHALVPVTRCQQMSFGHRRSGCSKHDSISFTKERP